MPLPADDRGGPSLRVQRLKLAWLFAIPFLFFAAPSALSFGVGLLLSSLGLLLRAWAAGSIDKERTLARKGPYAWLRHPLYAGTFLTGAGLAVAGGRWWIPLIFAGLFLWFYGRTIREEERELELRFGEEYLRYRTEVQAFLPRRPLSTPPAPPTGFGIRLYLRNKEWQAPLGVMVGYGLLWARSVLGG